MTAGTTARKVARSDGFKGLAKLGFAARGTIYLLIGWFAVLLALGKQPPETDQRGALQEVVRHNGGFLLLWVIAIGLTGYALFRFSEAAFGVVGDTKGHEKGPRLKSLFRGCLYAFFAVNAFNLLATARTKSQAGQQQQLTTRVMQHSLGRWLVGIVGAVVIVVGLALVYEGLKRKFKKYFALADMPTGSRRIVWFLGTFGTTARGVVFALTGFFLVRAAWDYDPSKARGLDGALRRTVADSDLGRTLVGVVAVGLIAFGLYCYAEAAWRRT
ncbi:DUF1206 domain-containing protein [Jatrophihabitans sp.]|uniref:DUF1206 domain-containing protein n=1 Tax=Jatrophihabitans sp. TaxID=1932789 RepID=UPI002CA543A2|nr:DUF1206 domain-containing protein [Jatrophihabitans sp.]